MVRKSIFKFLQLFKSDTLSRYQQLEKSFIDFKSKLFVPPGHYYSSIHDPDTLPGTTTIDYTAEIPGVDLNEPLQFELLNRLKVYYSENHFPVNKEASHRYYFDNDYFGYSDGIILNGMIREFKPRKIVEIGSGFSSALMMDTNDKYMGGQVNLSFIEPCPEERLLNLISENDHGTVIKDFVQNIGNDVWDSLEKNDMLFIDSSHVSKYQSDVNFLFFNVLPRLKPGVIIHIHDVFFPFEYPLDWLKQGRAWSETYLLRAFLQFNNDFEIILFTSFLEGRYRNWFKTHMPLCLKVHKKIIVKGRESFIETTGQSIYIRRK